MGTCGSPSLLVPRRAIESHDEIGDDPAMMSLDLRRAAAVALVLCLAVPVSAAAGESGRDIAAACASCHHGDRRAGAAIPGLAGMDKAAMIARVREFRAGKRPSTIMRQLANGYTDAQIEAAAGYWSAQPP